MYIEHPGYGKIVKGKFYRWTSLPDTFLYRPSLVFVSLRLYRRITAGRDIPCSAGILLTAGYPDTCSFTQELPLLIISGTYRVSRVPVHLSLYMPRPDDTGRPSGISPLTIPLYRLPLQEQRRRLLHRFNGAVPCFRGASPPAACIVPCVRFVWVVRQIKSILPGHATLGTGGWLNLTQQGLSPCKRYQTLPGALL